MRRTIRNATTWSSCALCGLPSGWRTETVSAMRASRAPWGSLPREPFPSPTARPTSPKCTILTDGPNIGCHTSGPKSSTFCGIPTLFHTRVLPWCNVIPTTLCRRPSLALDHTRRTDHPGMHQGEVPLNFLQCALDANGKQERIRGSPCSPPSACVTSRASPPSLNHW